MEFYLDITVAVLVAYITSIIDLLILELLVENYPNIGILTTFLQFLVITLLSFIVTLKCGFSMPNFYIQDYLRLFLFHFIGNVLSGVSFGLSVPMPLHIILKFGLIITDAYLSYNDGDAYFNDGEAYFNDNDAYLNYNDGDAYFSFNDGAQYNIWQKLGHLMLLLGIIFCTVYSIPHTDEFNQDSFKAEFMYFSIDAPIILHWIAGVACILLAVVLYSKLAIWRNKLNLIYGGHPLQVMCYSHMFSLPAFVIFLPSIRHQLNLTANSKPVHMPFIDISLPSSVALLAFNSIAHYASAYSISYLDFKCAASTLKTVLILRRITSLILSIYLFDHVFITMYWIGLSLILVGIILHYCIPHYRQRVPVAAPQPPEELFIPFRNYYALMNHI